MSQTNPFSNRPDSSYRWNRNNRGISVPRVNQRKFGYNNKKGNPRLTRFAVSRVKEGEEDAFLSDKSTSAGDILQKLAEPTESGRPNALSKPNPPKLKDSVMFGTSSNRAIDQAKPDGKNERNSDRFEGPHHGKTKDYDTNNNNDDFKPMAQSQKVTGPVIDLARDENDNGVGEDRLSPLADNMGESSSSKSQSSSIEISTKPTTLSSERQLEKPTRNLTGQRHGGYNSTQSPEDSGFATKAIADSCADEVFAGNHSYEQQDTSTTPLFTALTLTRTKNLDLQDSKRQMEASERTSEKNGNGLILGMVDCASKAVGDLISTLAGSGSSKKRKGITRVHPGQSLESKPASSTRLQNQSTKKRKMSENSFFSPPMKSSLLRRKSTPEIVEIEDDEVEDDDNIVRPKSSKYDVVRISIGSQVLRCDCQVTLFNSKGREKSSLALTFRLQKRQTRSGNSGETKTINFNVPGELKNVVYFMPDDGEEAISSFLAFQSSDNPSLNKALREVISTFLPETHYIVVEFREDLELQILLKDADGLINVEKIKKGLEDDYCKALKEDYWSEEYQRKSSKPQTPKNSRFLKGKTEEEILLVYPFNGDVDSIERAADGLNEVNMLEMTTVSKNLPPSFKGGCGRGHFLTIRVHDYMRLEPEEWLNDTLIDFWMKWISRGGSERCHFFSTHFFTTLSDKGVTGVKNWTEKKGIDIFNKHFVFIPINKNLHWSLAVVVNPGCIEDTNTQMDDLCPCILFFDSLGSHNKQNVAQKIRVWLNAEWNRLGKGISVDPFTKQTMDVFAPKVPYQNNGWDCGVFVCRYAYGLYLMRNRRFTFREWQVRNDRSPEKRTFVNSISDSPEFTFGDSDIMRIRSQMKTLIENLSVLYKSWRETTDEAEKKESMNFNDEKYDIIESDSPSMDQIEESQFVGTVESAGPASNCNPVLSGIKGKVDPPPSCLKLELVESDLKAIEEKVSEVHIDDTKIGHSYHEENVDKKQLLLLDVDIADSEFGEEKQTEEDEIDYIAMHIGNQMTLGLLNSQDSRASHVSQAESLLSQPETPGWLRRAPLTHPGSEILSETPAKSSFSSNVHPEQQESSFEC